MNKSLLILFLAISSAFCDAPKYSCEEWPDNPTCRTVINQNQPQYPTIQHFTVFDVRGVFLGVVSGYSIELATEALRLPTGQYCLKATDGSTYKVKK